MAKRLYRASNKASYQLPTKPHTKPHTRSLRSFLQSCIPSPYTRIFSRVRAHLKSGCRWLASVILGAERFAGVRRRGIRTVGEFEYDEPGTVGRQKRREFEESEWKMIVLKYCKSMYLWYVSFALFMSIISTNLNPPKKKPRKKPILIHFHNPPLPPC